jgi:broad specificity phosphatase PhoE
LCALCAVFALLRVSAVGGRLPQVEERFPKEAALRKKDKLSYRYPRGESYLDVIARLEPLVQEIERHRESLLIVGHQVGVGCGLRRPTFVHIFFVRVLAPIFLILLFFKNIKIILWSLNE